MDINDIAHGVIALAGIASLMAFIRDRGKPLVPPSYSVAEDKPPEKGEMRDGVIYGRSPNCADTSDK